MTAKPRNYWVCGEVPYTCDGYDPADWPGEPPAELRPIRLALQGITWRGLPAAAQHTYTAACDGLHGPGPCPHSHAPR
jgi:hypothetical protein